MHALDAQQETLYLEALSISSAMKSGDTLCMECRCSLDEAFDNEHGKGHYVDLLKSLNFTIKL